MLILRKIHEFSVDEAQELVSNLSKNNLEDLYCESVEYKKQLPLAYERLSNEMNKRKDLQINEGFNK